VLCLFLPACSEKERAAYEMKTGQMYMQGIMNSEGEEGIYYAAVLQAIPAGGQLSVTDTSIVITTRMRYIINRSCDRYELAQSWKAGTGAFACCVTNDE